MIRSFAYKNTKSFSVISIKNKTVNTKTRRHRNVEELPCTELMNQSSKCRDRKLDTESGKAWKKTKEE